METLNSFFSWIFSWQSDQIITTWVKANAIISAVIAIGIRTIANRTSTTLDNEFLGRLKERFGMDK